MAVIKAASHQGMRKYFSTIQIKITANMLEILSIEEKKKVNFFPLDSKQILLG